MPSGDRHYSTLNLTWKNNMTEQRENLQDKTGRVLNKWEVGDH